jgi:hypothetical protein
MFRLVRLGDGSCWIGSLECGVRWLSRECSNRDRICCSSQVQLRTERELVVTYCIPPGGVVGTPPSLRRLGTYRGVESADDFWMR